MGRVKETPMKHSETSLPAVAHSGRDGRYRIVFSAAIGCAVLDQLTKLAVAAWIPYQHGIEVIPGFFDLVHVRNRGAAFGILNRPDMDWQFWLFLAATLVAAGVILNMARSARFSRALFLGFGLILGGAVGNLIDRVRLRAVIDFMDLHIAGWHWPAFNVADMGICFGAALCILYMWRQPGAAKGGKA